MSATARICVALVSLTVCALMLAELLGLLPDRTAAIVDGRIALTESVAVACSLAAQRQDLSEIETVLASVVERNETLNSSGFRLREGELVVNIGDHLSNWAEGAPPGPHQMRVPLHLGETVWGNVEMCFAPADVTFGGVVTQSSLLLLSFMSVASFLGFFWYLRRVLTHLDPSRVIPDRVRTTLDTLAEGLLVFDRYERIVMANSTFSQVIGVTAEELLGKEASSLPWILPAGEYHAFPWSHSIDTSLVQTDCRLRVQCKNGEERVFKVNAAPIFSDDGNNRGALATFSDVTELEERNSQLHETLTKLESSREQIRRHNEQLRTLATRDPLTGCMNRRAFFEEAEKEIRSAELKGHVVSYMILDVDHFKSINDNHGHAVGDDVLKAVGKLVESRFKDAGVVCRYGGEEFSVLLPRLNEEQTEQIGDAFRKALEGSAIVNLRVTASVGVAQLESLSSQGLRDVMDRADRALYAAKRGGRNQVRRWEQIKDQVQETDQPAASPLETSNQEIPYTAVSALCSALHYRDAATAEHCRRVANLAATVGRGIMSEERRYILEVAALLHDIGKLGVPDAVLHKPGALTAEEWKIMKTYQKVGVVILENAFTNEDLVGIIRSYRADYGGTDDRPDWPVGAEIPLEARLLKIADAYDSMTNRKSYRDSLSQDKAFEELRRWSTRQFDPELVERFIDVVIHLDDQEHQLDNMTRRAAVQLGLETEKLVCALDAQDRLTLKEMVGRLKGVAEENNLKEILTLTSRVEQMVEEDAEWLELLGTAVDLLDTCRNAQWACVIDQQSSCSV